MRKWRGFALSLPRFHLPLKIRNAGRQEMNLIFQLFHEPNFTNDTNEENLMLLNSEYSE